MDLYQEIVNLKRDNDKAWQLVKKLEEENTALQNGLRNSSAELEYLKVRLDKTKKTINTLLRQRSKLGKKNTMLRRFIVQNCDMTITALNTLINSKVDNH